MRIRKIPSYEGATIRGIRDWVVETNGKCYCYSYYLQGQTPIEWNEVYRKDIEQLALGNLYFSQILTKSPILKNGEISLKDAMVESTRLEFLIVMGVSIEESLKKSGIII